MSTYNIFRMLLLRSYEPWGPKFKKINVQPYIALEVLIMP